MKLDRYTLFFGILFAIVLFGTNANAQSATSYRFLEVVDTEGRPVANATVEARGFKGQTDEEGAIKSFPVQLGDFQTTTFTVSKPGFITYVEMGETLDGSRFRFWRDRKPEYDPGGSTEIRVELFRIPVDEEERKAVTLMVAVKQSDVNTIRRLTQSGVDVNVPDQQGVPAIVWAVTGDTVSIAYTLLDAGADLRANYAGRKALLYYLDSWRNTDPSRISEELVGRLLAAGADVNATDIDGRTALLLAKQSGNANLIRLLETAGAREK